MGKIIVTGIEKGSRLYIRNEKCLVFDDNTGKMEWLKIKDIVECEEEVYNLKSLSIGFDPSEFLTHLRREGSTLFYHKSFKCLDDGRHWDTIIEAGEFGVCRVQFLEDHNLVVDEETIYDCSDTDSVFIMYIFIYNNMLIVRFFVYEEDDLYTIVSVAIDKEENIKCSWARDLVDEALKYCNGEEDIADEVDKLQY